MSVNEIRYHSASEVIENSDEEIPPEDFEPGASSEGILASCESYEDVLLPLTSSIDKASLDLPTPIKEISIELLSPKIKTQPELEASTAEVLSTSSCDDSNVHSSPEPDSLKISSTKVPSTPTKLSPSPVDPNAPIYDKDKNIFILSSSGKPIYTRYGNEEQLVTFMGVTQALISFVQSNDDQLQSLHTETHRFIFLVRDPLILVAVSKTDESAVQLAQQCTLLYNQLLSVLTLSQLTNIFKQHTNFDLRRLFSDTDKRMFDNLFLLIDLEPGLLLGSIQCLPLSTNVRETISQTLARFAGIQSVVFVILLVNSKLVALVRLKKYYLHPIDLHLLINLITTNSEALSASESWIPICFPKFDSSGFLHTHLSYFEEVPKLCLAICSIDKDLFFQLQESRSKIVKRLTKYACFDGIRDSLRTSDYKCSSIGLGPAMRHFVYKSKSTAQYTSPVFEAPYSSTSEQKRILSLYKVAHNHIHTRQGKPLKLVYHSTIYESTVGWSTTGFELYAVFGPLLSKPIAISYINRLLKWIKHEEDRLFIRTSPAF